MLLVFGITGGIYGVIKLFYDKKKTTKVKSNFFPNNTLSGHNATEEETIRTTFFRLCF